MNINKLKGCMRELGMTQEEVANKIGISLSRFNAKINERNGAEFNLTELRVLRHVLSLSDKQVIDIFFK